MDSTLIINLLFSMVASGTPLLLVALGETVCEKSGVMNLGQEGMMLMGAVCGFMVAFTTGHVAYGFIAAIVAGVLMSLLFAALALGLNSNQVATGLALTIFGAGLASFIGKPFVGKRIEGVSPWEIPGLSEIPAIGKIFFSQDPIVYLSLILFAVVFWFFRKSRMGLIVKAVGENPHAANAIGLPVLRTRCLAIMFGGALSGLAGSYLSLVNTPMWMENMTAGRGWIALALVVFASWKAERVLLGAWLFALVSVMRLAAQGLGFSISSDLTATFPYVATIVVLVILSSNKARARLLAPMSLGQPFHPSK